MGGLGLGARFGQDTQANHRFDIARLDLATGFEAAIQRLKTRNRALALVAGSVQRQLVSAPHDDDTEALLERGEVAVELATKLDQQTVIGEFDKSLVQRLRHRDVLEG